MVYYGNGGFTFNDLYTMPIYLRNFYAKKMTEAKQAEAEQYKKANKQSVRTNPNIPQKRFGRR
tara:strand:+ start:646 stop:834 length:189 start_codon:yes stop_codon:yes gene_type:complete